MNVISSSSGAGFQFGLQTTMTTSSVFSLGETKVATKSTAGRHRHVASRRPIASVPVVSSSASVPLSGASFNGTDAISAFKSFGGFNFNAFPSSGATAVTTSTSSVFTFTDLKVIPLPPSTAAKNGKFTFGQPSTVTSDAAPPTFGAIETSGESSTSSSLPSSGTGTDAFVASTSKNEALTSDTWTFTLPTSSFVPLVDISVPITTMAKSELSNGDSTPILSEALADLTALTATTTTQSVGGPISSPFQNTESTESRKDEQEKEQVLITQATQVNESFIGQMVKTPLRDSQEWAEYSQIVAKLDDINFSLSILICLFFFIAAFQVGTSFN